MAVCVCFRSVLRALHDFFHRQVRSEREAQLLSKLLRAETEIAVGARQQIVLKPLFVIFESGGGFFLQRCKILLHLRCAIKNGGESFTHEIDCALRLLNRCFRMNARRVLQVGFCLRDHARNSFHALAQIWNPLFRRREIARDQQIKAVGQALHVNERIPFRLFQLFSSEDFVIDVLLEDAKIDIVRTGELRSIDGSSACRETPFALPVLSPALRLSNQSVDRQTDGPRARSHPPD